MRVKMTLYILLISSGLYSQSNPYKQYTQTDGLNSSTVYCSYQDLNGLIWFGTDKGVNWFDGSKFTSFSLNDGLSDSEIFKIQNDSQQKIWLLTNNGIPSIYYDSEFKTRRTYSGLTKFPGGSFLWCQFQDKNGNQWFGTQSDGILKLDTTGKITKYDPDNLSTCFHIWTDEQDRLLFATKSGVYRFERGMFTKLFSYDRNKKRRFSTQDGFVLFSEGEKLMTTYDNKSYRSLVEFVSSILFIGKVENNKVLIGTNTGLFEYNFSSGKKRIILPNIAVSSTLKDHEGGLWITTLKHGVFYIAGNSPKRIDPCEECSNDEYRLYQQQNKLVIAGNTICSLNTIDSKWNIVHQFLDPKIRVNKVITSKKEDFIATNNGLYKKVNNKDVLYLSGTAVKDIEIINKTDLVLVLSRSIVKIAIDSLGLLGEPTIDRNELKKHLIFDLSKPTCIEKSKLGIWIGTVDGVYFYSLKTHSIIDLRELYPEIACTINDLLLIGNSLWIATKGKGVYQLLLNENHLIHYTKKNSIQSNYCSSLYYDDQTDQIIAIHTKGLDIWDKGQWLNIPLNLRINEGRGALAIIRGNYYLSDGNKLYSFSPSLWLSSLEHPRLNVYSLYINDRREELINNFTSSYDNNSIKLNFRASSFRLSSLIKYHYELKKNDLTIISESLKGSELQLASLSPGKYNIKVWATSRNNLTSKPYLLTFTILPPWWESWWFFLLIIILLLGVIYLFFKIRVLTYNKDIVREILSAIVKRIKRERKIVFKDNEGKYITINNMNDLLHVKSAGNYVEIHCTNKHYVTRITMKEIELQLSDYSNFVRIHHSHLVNMDHISEVGRDHVVIREELIPVSRRKRNRLITPNQKEIIHKKT